MPGIDHTLMSTERVTVDGNLKYMVYIFYDDGKMQYSSTDLPGKYPFAPEDFQPEIAAKEWLDDCLYRKGLMEDYIEQQQAINSIMSSRSFVEEQLQAQDYEQQYADFLKSLKLKDVSECVDTFFGDKKNA